LKNFGKSIASPAEGHFWFPRTDAPQTSVQTGNSDQTLHPRVRSSVSPNPVSSIACAIRLTFNLVRLNLCLVVWSVGWT